MVAGRLDGYPSKNYSLAMYTIIETPLFADDARAIWSEEERGAFCTWLAARERTGLSQARFAELSGVSIRTLHEWEQGQGQPSGAARTLFRVAERHPDVLRERG